MCSFKSIYFVLFYIVLNNTNAQISDKRLCIDPDCSVPISYAKTLLRYSSPDPRILSFAPNQEVTVYSKHAGSDTNLWGAEINGKRGYIPKLHVREYRVVKRPEILVDTELNKTPEVPEETKERIEPESVKEAFEVVDGTTIYFNNQEIKPSAVDDTVQPTSIPPSTEENKSNEEKTPIIEEDSAKLLKTDNLPATQKENKKEAKESSVVDNVFSTLTNWIGEDDQSDEYDDEEDDEEDGDVEDDEDEEDPEETKTISAEINGTLAGVVEETSTIPHTEETVDAKIIEELNKENNISEEKISTDTTIVEKTGVNDTSVPDTVNSPEVLTNFLNQGIKIASYSGNLEEPVIKADTIPDSIKIESNLSGSIPQEKKEEQQPPTSDFTSKNESDITKSDGEPEVIEKNTPTEVKPEENINEEIKSEAVTQTPLADIPETPLPIVVTETSILSDDTIVNKEFEFVTPDPLGSANEEPTKETDHQEVKPEEASTSPISENSPDYTNEEPAKETDHQEVKAKEASTLPISENSQADSNIPEVKVPSPPLFNFGNVPDVSINDVPTITNKENDDLSKDEPFFNNENIAVSNEESTPSSIEETESTPPVVSEGDNSLNTDEAPAEDLNTPKPEETVDIQPDLLDKLTPEAFGISTDLPESVEKDDDIEENQLDSDPRKDIVREVIINLNKNDDTSPIFVDKIVEADYNSNKNKQEESAGIFSRVYEYFSTTREINIDDDSDVPLLPELSEGLLPSKNQNDAAPGYCYDDKCEEQKSGAGNESSSFNFFNFNADVFLYLTTTAVSVIVFLFGYIAIDKSKRETPLVARINKLEKQLLITLKENEMLQEQGGSIQIIENTNSPSSEVVDNLSQQLAELTNAKHALEEQVQALEKELDTSTEVGMELNRIVSEMLSSSNGSETLKANVEQLQRQLLEQQDTINSVNETLSLKETENLELNLELEISNKKVVGLQSELDRMVEKLLKIEEERDLQQSSLESEIILYQQKHKEASSQVEALNREMQLLKSQLSEAKRNAELKMKEYNILKNSLGQIKSVKNDSDTLKSILDVTAIKAELQQLKSDNQELLDKLSHEEVAKINLEKLIETNKEECELLKQKYELADKEKLEINTKLDILNNYFKEKEAQLLKEISRYESIWATKEGEATSTTERIKYIQEELQNYKAQNETLKQEIVNQEVELKSQISVLEKKIHENWVAARQSERKLEDSRHEAAQLRNRLTLRERALNEEKAQNRLQSPMELNGEHPLSPQPHQSPASPPLLFGTRDHITKSPPMPPGLPFLPPPPGAPFMPPPMPGMPPFMPPPPSMYPDHRPPPLGRMSSPPLNSRYSPESTVYSGYDRNSPSPPYDSEYGTSPPMRAYSPYDDRRDYKRQAHKVNGRNMKGSGLSSGSDDSHESLGKSNRKHSKV